MFAAVLASAVQGFAPQYFLSTTKSVTSLSALEQDENNYIPPNNNWFPKHNKALIGDFYGELNTQKELKVPKEALIQTERPEAVMMQKEQQARTGYKAPPAQPAPPANVAPTSAVTPTSVSTPASLE
eukprot:scaffold443_cov177-Amphora_coffeaeformis.AAC.13